MNVTTTTVFVQIDRYGEMTAKVWSPFQAKDVIKYSVSSGFRTWDPQSKCWEVRGDIFIYCLVRDLRNARFVVNLIDPAGLLEAYEANLKARAKAAAAPEVTSSPSWADDMFSALPEELHAGVFKALLKVLHPDRGGDLKAMQTVNAARDRLAA